MPGVPKQVSHPSSVPVQRFLSKPRLYFHVFLPHRLAFIFPNYNKFLTPMPRPGIELTAELHLLEGPFMDALPTELKGRNIGPITIMINIRVFSISSENSNAAATGSRLNFDFFIFRKTTLTGFTTLARNIKTRKAQFSQPPFSII